MYMNVCSNAPWQLKNLNFSVNWIYFMVRSGSVLGHGIITSSNINKILEKVPMTAWTSLILGMLLQGRIMQFLESTRAKLN